MNRFILFLGFYVFAKIANGVDFSPPTCFKKVKGVPLSPKKHKNGGERSLLLRKSLFVWASFSY